MSAEPPVAIQERDVTEPVHPGGHGEAGGLGTAPLRRHPLLAIPLVGIALVLIITVVALLGQDPARPSGVPLGAASQMTGGIARINGLIPLARDGWRPPGGAPELQATVPEGAHLVRVLLELTAVDPRGMDFDARDFTVGGLGSVDARLLWADPVQRVIPQGKSVTATLVYQIPDRPAALILAGEGARLDLGSGHYTR